MHVLYFYMHVLYFCYVRHAHAHMHALHIVHMRVPYGTEPLPKTRASLMQHCMVAASRVDPWPKLVFSATTDCALHPYVSTTYRRPIYHVHVSKVEFLRAAGNRFGNWEVKRSSFTEKIASVQHRPSAPSGLVMRNHPLLKPSKSGSKPSYSRLS